ncbi:36882_t:CDS:1, partial [Racocetra persica]
MQIDALPGPLLHYVTQMRDINRKLNDRHSYEILNFYSEQHKMIRQDKYFIILMDK